MFKSTLAHISADHGLVGGILHPLLGLDHILAMVAVGLIAAQRPTGARYHLPLVFVGVMALGFAFGAAGLVSALPTEATITLSVIVLGLAAAFATRLHPVVLVALVALSALAHGQAHGLEAVPPLVPYGLGMVAATAVLHAAGFAFAHFAKTRLIQFSGLGIAATGLVLIVA